MIKHLKISLGILEELINCYDDEDRDSLARFSSIKKRIETEYSINATSQDISDNYKRINIAGQLDLRMMFINDYAFGENGVYTKSRLSYIEYVAEEFRKEIFKSEQI